MTREEKISEMGVNNRIQIEFYHDVLCAWAYAFSPRMRRLVREFPEVEVIHRSFVLAPDRESISQMFDSVERGKKEILGHWLAANENDDSHRIRAELMETREFDYPHSMPGQMACKAAELQGGQRAHWDYFDRVQSAHLTECRNIADSDVLVSCAWDVGLDFERFERDHKSPQTKGEVLLDIRRARNQGVTASPTIVMNGRWTMSGARGYDELRSFLEKII